MSAVDNNQVPRVSSQGASAINQNNSNSASRLSSVAASIRDVAQLAFQAISDFFSWIAELFCCCFASIHSVIAGPANPERRVFVVEEAAEEASAVVAQEPIEQPPVVAPVVEQEPVAQPPVVEQESPAVVAQEPVEQPPAAQQASPAVVAEVSVVAPVVPEVVVAQESPAALQPVAAQDNNQQQQPVVTQEQSEEFAQLVLAAQTAKWKEELAQVARVAAVEQLPAVPQSVLLQEHVDEQEPVEQPPVVAQVVVAQNSDQQSQVVANAEANQIIEAALPGDEEYGSDLDENFEEQRTYTIDEVFAKKGQEVEAQDEVDAEQEEAYGVPPVVVKQQTPSYANAIKRSLSYAAVTKGIGKLSAEIKYPKVTARHK